MRVAGCCGLGLAVCLLSRAVHAAPPVHADVRLELTRPDDAQGCIDARRLGQAVERRLHRRVFSTGDALLSVRVDWRREDGAFVAEIEVSDQKGPLGRRQLSTKARHCSALDDSLALVVALLVDSPPERVAPPVAAAPPAAKPPPTAKPPIPSAPTESAPLATPAATRIEVPSETLAPREPWQFFVRASGSAAFGLLPSVALAPELAVAARPPRAPLLRVTLDYYLPQTESISASGTARLQRRRVGVEVCAPEAFISLGSLCFGQRLGQLQASGSGFDHSFDRRVFTFAFSGAFDLRFPLGRYFALSLGARLEVPLSRHRFDARLSDGSTHEVFQEPFLQAAARAGVEVEL